jgi:hypothetical protein
MKWQRINVIVAPWLALYAQLQLVVSRDATLLHVSEEPLITWRRHHVLDAVELGFRCQLISFVEHGLRTAGG